MNDLIRIDDTALFPREFRTPTLRTLSYDAYYRDINNQWNVGIDALSEDESAVKRQIDNLLGTPIGSEHFEPTYASDLPYRIMDPITPMMAFLIETDTFLAIWKWMRDRVHVDYTRSRITPLETNDGYLVDLDYYIIKSSRRVLYKFEILR